jgi:hypothetical protein
LGEALDELPELNADTINDAAGAVARTHPIDPALRDTLVKRVLCDHYDEIDDSLKDRNLKPDTPWGLAIYRVAYGDQAAWERILAELNKILVDWGRMDRRARHHLVVMDDRSRFNGATIDQVRNHFRKWSLDEVKRN